MYPPFVHNWCVRGDESLSDNRYVTFDVLSLDSLPPPNPHPPFIFKTFYGHAGVVSALRRAESSIRVKFKAAITDSCIDKAYEFLFDVMSQALTTVKKKPLSAKVKGYSWWTPKRLRVGIF